MFINLRNILNLVQSKCAGGSKNGGSRRLVGLNIMKNSSDFFIYLFTYFIVLEIQNDSNALFDSSPERDINIVAVSGGPNIQETIFIGFPKWASET